MAKNQTEVTIPRDLLNSLVKAQEEWESFHNELEDFLISANSSLLKEMKEVRREHKEDKLIDVEDL